MSYALLFTRGFLTLLLSRFFAITVAIPSRGYAISDVSHSLHGHINRSSLLNATTRCVLPDPLFIPVSLQSCQPGLRRLLIAPDAEVPRLYAFQGAPLKIIDSPGCVISLDKRRVWGEIWISTRRIEGYALQVLVLCDYFGQGGWTHIDGNEDWIVIVSGGEEKGILLGNKTVDVGIDRLSRELRAR